MDKAARIAESPHLGLQTLWGRSTSTFGQPACGQREWVLWHPGRRWGVLGGAAGTSQPPLPYFHPPPPSPGFLLQIKATICYDKCSHSPFPSYLLPRREVLWSLTASSPCWCCVSAAIAPTSRPSPVPPPLGEGGSGVPGGELGLLVCGARRGGGGGS